MANSGFSLLGSYLTEVADGSYKQSQGVAQVVMAKEAKESGKKIDSVMAIISSAAAALPAALLFLL